MPILLGCAAPTTDVAPSPTVVPSPTATPLPSPTSSPSPTPPAATATHTPVQEDAAGRLVSRWTDAPPEIDGQAEEVWAAAELLRLPLTWGWEGTEHALDVELRSLHTDQALYFFAQWPGKAPADGTPDSELSTVSNVLTLHWRIPDPAAQRLDCAVACHTAFADGAGRLAYANAETIPQGGSAALDAAGGWEAGTWTVEWSRPLINGNPYDLQFDDLALGYSFRVKVFKRVEGRPDPVSKRHLVVFSPSS